MTTLADSALSAFVVMWTGLLYAGCDERTPWETWTLLYRGQVEGN